MQDSEILIAVVVFLFVGFVVWLSSLRDRAKIRYRAEIQKELIARFSSARELSDFLNSEAGKLLIRGPDGKSPPPAEAARKSPQEHVLGGIAFGILALSVGSAFLIARGMTLPGAVFSALGIGFLLNALVGYLLTRKWGIWNQAPECNASKTNVS